MNIPTRIELAVTAPAFAVCTQLPDAFRGADCPGGGQYPGVRMDPPDPGGWRGHGDRRPRLAAGREEVGCQYARRPQYPPAGGGHGGHDMSSVPRPVDLTQVPPVPWVWVDERVY